MTEEFDFIVSKIGSPSTGVPIPLDRLQAYSGRLPGSLIDFYAAYGAGLVLDGFFQFCDPDSYAPIARSVFGEDKDLPSSRCHIIGFSAFGTLNVWSEDHGTVHVNLMEGTASCLSLFGRGGRLPKDQSVAIGLFQLDGKSNDAFDAAGRTLFKRARKVLGRLPVGSIYGFVPILALGGARKLESLKIVSALEHMALLASAGPIKLIDTSTMAMRPVRLLG